MQIEAGECTAVANAAQNPDGVLGKSLVIMGGKYMVLRGDDASIYCRKGSEGCCIAKTGQAVLIGMYNENQQAGSCNAVVEKLADYLKESGY